MELMQLEMFVAMVEEGSFHRAAARVYRTQPAVSMALRRLEQELGAPLFDRSNRSDYTLTSMGEVLYEYARRLINLRDETVVALQDLHTLQSGRLRIGANESTSLYLLPKLILLFREQCPKIKIEVFRHVSNRLPYEVRQRNLDFAILSFLPEDNDLDSSLIMRDELVLIVSPEHRLSQSQHVHIKELGSEAFIAHNAQSPSRKKVIEAFRRFQTPLNITIEIATIETVKKFVGMNLGVGFVPLMCVQEEIARGELAAVAVEGFRHERSLWVVRRRTDAHSHAAQAFLQVLGSHTEKLQAAHQAYSQRGTTRPVSDAIN
ncbi:MAG TPA: LysR family transcriptional regulator [Blastocatellia bacterium]|jgi:DNA-binding transcriptional LysR family regulator|nr:LysR family transcriptional regulator [Blastocatellia bacterium]